MRVHYSFVLSACFSFLVLVLSIGFLWPVYIVDLRPFSCRRACFAADFIGLWFCAQCLFLLMCHLLTTHLLLMRCVPFSDAPSVRIVIDLRTFFCRWAFCSMIFCDMLFFWPSLGLLRSIVAWLNRLLTTLHAMTTLSRCGFWIIIFFSSFTLLQMQCYCIRFAFEGGVRVIIMMAFGLLYQVAYS